MYVKDDGGTANHGDDTSPGYTVKVTVEAVNDPPVTTNPGHQNTSEGTSLDITGVTVDDADVNETAAPDNILQLTLTVDHGLITICDPSAVNFAVGDGADDVTMTFTGTSAEINSAIKSITYTPYPGYTGQDILEVAAADQGHSGSGGEGITVDSIYIDVEANPTIVQDDTDSPYDWSGKPYQDDESLRTDDTGSWTDRLSTVGSIPTIQDLLERVSSAELLPDFLSRAQGAGTVDQTEVLSQFGALLHESLFGEDVLARNLAWAGLFTFVSERSRAEDNSEWLDLTDFLAKLKTWQFGNTPGKTLLVFNAEEIKLVEWFSLHMAPVDDRPDSQEGSALDPDGLWKAPRLGTALVFNLDKLRISDLIEGSLGTDDYAGIGVPTGEINSVCKVYDLSSISLVSSFAS
jgi:hypothetical protein